MSDAEFVDYGEEPYLAMDFFKDLHSERDLFIEPKDFKPINGSNYLFHQATHLIYAPAKQGKTTVIVNEVSKTDMKAVILDGDGNSIEAVKKRGKNTMWLQPKDPMRVFNRIKKEIEGGLDCSEIIFVIDSLYNFSNGHDIDSNRGMSEILQELKILTATGGTLVILHHTTGSGSKAKIKGNEEVAKGKCDAIFAYTRATGLELIDSRIDALNAAKPTGARKTI